MIRLMELRGTIGRRLPEVLQRHEHALMLLLVLVCMALTCLRLVSAPQVTLFPDEAQQLANSYQFCARMEKRDSDWPTPFLKISNVWPPLGMMTSAFIYRLTEPSYAIAVFSIFLFFASALYGVRALAREDARPESPFLASLLTAFYLLPYAWQYMMDVPVVACVVTALLLMSRRPFDSWGKSALLGMVLGIGALTKWQTGIFLLAPGLVLLGAHARRVRSAKDSWLLAGRLALMISCALVVMWPWYAANFQGQLATARKANHFENEASLGRRLWFGLNVAVHQILPLSIAVFGAGGLLKRSNWNLKWLLLASTYFGGSLLMAYMDHVANHDIYRYYLPAMVAVILLAFWYYDRAQRRIRILFLTMIAANLVYSGFSLVRMALDEKLPPARLGPVVFDTRPGSKGPVGIFARPSSTLIERSLFDKKTVQQMSETIASTCSPHEQPPRITSVGGLTANFHFALQGSLCTAYPAISKHANYFANEHALATADDASWDYLVVHEQGLGTLVAESLQSRGTTLREELADSALIYRNRGICILKRLPIEGAAIDLSQVQGGRKALEPMYVRNLHCRQLAFDAYGRGAGRQAIFRQAADPAGFVRFFMPDMKVYLHDWLPPEHRTGPLPADVFCKGIQLMDLNDNENEAFMKERTEFVQRFLKDCPERGDEDPIREMNWGIVKCGGNSLSLIVAFRARKPVPPRTVLFLHADPADEHKNLLTPNRQKWGFENWSFWPVEPSQTWHEKDFILARLRFEAHPIPYRIAWGWYNPEGAAAPARVDAGWLDFAAIGDVSESGSLKN